MERFFAKYRVVAVTAVLVFFGAAFGVESFGNHLLFRTYGLDLGLFAQTARDFGHLHFNDGSFFLWSPANQLGGHFDLLLALLSPLTWLVRADWLLLAVQLLAVLAGAYGIYRLARDVTSSETVSLLAMLLMLCQFGVWHALGFDYHSNVVAACLLPWLILLVRRGRLGAATVVLMLMAIAKETVALWLVFVLAALLWDHRRDVRRRRWLIGATAGCTAYFLIVTLWIMPSLGGGGGSGFWRYSWMGGTVGEVAQWLLTHPLDALRSFFTDFTSAADSGQLKVEFFLCALASGMLFCLLKPNYLLMIVPPLAMKMLSADTGGFWGVTFHYNIEICIAGCCAAVATLGNIRRPQWRVATAAVAVLLAASTAFYTIDQPQTKIRQANVNIFKPSHYRQPEFNTHTARRALRMIPDDASVCTATPFAPHIACRDSAYLFPMGIAYGAEYYLILRDHWSYYEGDAQTVDMLVADTAHYRTLLTDSTIYLLQRID